MLTIAAVVVTLTFPDAVERAMRTRAAETAYDAQARALETLPVGASPVIRAETGISTARNVNILTEDIAEYDALTALVSVDYPLLDRGAAARRLAGIRADAQLLRRRAEGEAEQVFRETLDAFAALYLAQQRMAMLRDGSTRAESLRRRATAMLEAGQISNLTAAQWEDQALATESMLVDLELQRLDAEARLKQLIGDRSADELRPTIEESIRRAEAPFDSAQGRLRSTDPVVVRKRLALEDAIALRRPQVMLSGFAGVANVPGDDGTFGIYGLRVSLTLPMFESAAAHRIAQAKIELEEAERAQSLAEAARRNRIDLLRLALDANDKRLALLEQAVDVARRREESVVRLVRAGVRPEADLVDVTSNVARRESDLLALRVERWKLRQQLQWSAGAP